MHSLLIADRVSHHSAYLTLKARGFTPEGAGNILEVARLDLEWGGPWDDQGGTLTVFSHPSDDTFTITYQYPCEHYRVHGEHALTILVSIPVKWAGAVHGYTGMRECADCGHRVADPIARGE